MNAHRLHGTWLGFFFIVICALCFTGCQTLSAGGSGVVVSNASLAFGTVASGSSKTLPDTLTNTTASSVTISSISGSSSDVQVLGISPPLALGAGQSVAFSVQFHPSATGNVSRTISLLGANSEVLVSLKASGKSATPGQLSPNPSSVAFGSMKVGSSQTNRVTLSNTGGTDLTVNQATLSGAGFSTNNLSLPLTLHAGGTTSLNVTFAPTGSGNFNGTVTFATNSTSNVVLPISGTGVASGQLTANPSSLAFGSVQDGNSSRQSTTLTNTTGTALTISAATASGSGFSLSGSTLPVTLNAGQSTSLTVQFAPTSSGAASGSISITSNGANPSLSIPLSGTGVTLGSLAANPSSLSFGSVQRGNSSSKSETLTNTSASAVTISQANVNGGAFSVSGLTLPAILSSNQSVTFTVTFAPTGGGSASGTVSIVSGASNSPLSVALSGTGTVPGQLAVSPTTLSFGNVVVGSSSSLNGTLNATGAAVTISSDSIANEFALSGISLPATIAAGTSASFTVTFTPQSSGVASGSLSFTSNATNSAAAQSLTGTGTAPAQHSVDLTWNSSANAVGYNVYRSSVSGGPYSLINTSLDASTAFTDNNVVAGRSYHYVVTAVDGSSKESGYSNQTSAVIPTP